MSSETATITLAPQDGLVDEPLDIRISGLQPNEPVTVRAQTRFSEETGTWSTSAVYEADDQGNVDLNTASPRSGGFAVADANGLIWSLRPDNPDTNARRLNERLHSYELRVTVEAGDAVLERVITRRPVAKCVSLTEVRTPSLKANLFLPEGSGPFPTVLVLGGSGGGFPDQQAALFASHGFAAVSLGYFAVEGLPPELRRIPLEYFISAIDWIIDHPQLRADRLAVSGTSRGGELALLLASRDPRIRSVVAYVPSSHVWGAISRHEAEENDDYFAAWTVNGHMVPYAGWVRNDAVAPDENGVVSLAPAYLNYVQDTARSDAARIEVERINGPVLLISGQQDALWPSAYFGNQIMERARRNGFLFPIEHLSYDGAGHSIGAGYGPTTVNQSFHPIRKAYIDLGGTAEGLAQARADSWPRVLAFLAQQTAPERQIPNEVLRAEG
jgi:dienelactone hydrolase